nr:MAG TPA: hypothetical protein [Caudoviricetes sp.]DAU99001.1 MAG TPA: hypothetical protein [Bacteriophage sp.]
MRGIFLQLCVIFYLKLYLILLCSQGQSSLHRF